MKKYMTVSQAAARWLVSPARVRQWIDSARIPGVVRCGPIWLIPESTRRPAPLAIGRPRGT